MNIREKVSYIIHREAQALQNIEVSAHYETAINMLMACEGKVITTGIGKAGYIADKFAATLASTGTAAFFVHPAEAGHGDMGMVSAQDIIIAFSTSGKSIEVLENAAHLGASNVIGVTSHIDSPLRELSKVILDMGTDIEEPCPLKITPSATIAVMLAISDALALTLMELKGFSKHDYGMRHHKGYLGTITRQQHKYDSEGES